MGVKFANNFETTISGSINSSVTTIAITSATGFPSLGLGDYAYCTLQKELPATHEIVKVTAISGTSLTVVRAQEGTSASAFADGDAFAAWINSVWDGPSSVGRLLATGESPCQKRCAV